MSTLLVRYLEPFIKKDLGDKMVFLEIPFLEGIFTTGFTRCHGVKSSLRAMLILV